MFSYIFFKICSNVLLLDASAGLRAGLRAPAGLGFSPPSAGDIFFNSLHARPGFETPLSSYGEGAIRYIVFPFFLWLREAKMKVLDNRGVGIAPNGIKNCNPETK